HAQRIRRCHAAASAARCARAVLFCSCGVSERGIEVVGLWGLGLGGGLLGGRFGRCLLGGGLLGRSLACFLGRRFCGGFGGGLAGCLGCRLGRRFGCGLAGSLAGRLFGTGFDFEADLAVCLLDEVGLELAVGAAGDEAVEQVGLAFCQQLGD